MVFLKILLKIILSVAASLISMFFMMIAVTSLIFGGFWIFFIILTVGIAAIYYIMINELF